MAILVSLGFLTACSSEAGDLPYQINLEATHPYARQPGNTTALASPGETRDADGIVMYLDKKSGMTFYHPVSLSWEVLSLLGSYEQNHDQQYLDSAIKHAKKLAEIGEDHDGALWFPYRFDYAMNHDPAMKLPNPWYSGMAKGMALSVFSWLNEITEESSWKKLADSTFKSFEHSVSDALPESPWFVYSPDSETVWFEEYPGAGAPTHVINGHIYAAFGLIDYYRITQNVEAAKLFNSASQTGSSQCRV